MNLEAFEKILLNYKKYYDSLSELHDIGVDLYEGKYKLSEIVEEIFEDFLKVTYNEEGLDWINWFIHENEYGNKKWYKLKSLDNSERIEKPGYGAYDENGNPICYDVKSLFEYIEKFKI